MARVCCLALEGNFRLGFHLIFVEFHAKARSGGQGDNAVDRLQWALEKVLVDRVPLE